MWSWGRGPEERIEALVRRLEFSAREVESALRISLTATREISDRVDRMLTDVRTATQALEDVVSGIGMQVAAIEQDRRLTTSTIDRAVRAVGERLDATILAQRAQLDEAVKHAEHWRRVAMEIVEREFEAKVKAREAGAQNEQLGSGSSGGETEGGTGATVEGTGTADL
jgi:hypothetical protein